MPKDSTDPPARISIPEDQQFDYKIDPNTTKFLSQKRELSFSKKQLKQDKSGAMIYFDRSLIKEMSTNRFSQKKSGGLYLTRRPLTGGFGQLAAMAIENIKNKGADGLSRG